MKPILTDNERKAIEALIAKIEQDTASELVTVIYTKSSNYTAFRMGWATTLSLVSVVLLDLRFPFVPVLELFATEGLLAVLYYWILGYSPLLKLIVPHWAKAQAVHDKVRLLFLELGVTETRDRSGIIIFLSEFERRVEILGDRGIYEYLGESAWKALTSELTSAIRRGTAFDGLKNILEKLGTQLIAKFPARTDDVNELPNAVVTNER
jgi:putative membrane protein